MADEAEEKEFDESITLNIVHRFPEGVGLTFSDNIAVQHTQTEFTNYLCPSSAATCEET